VSIRRKFWDLVVACRLSLRGFVPQQVMSCSTREMADDNWRPSQSLLDSMDGFYHYAMNNKAHGSVPCDDGDENNSNKKNQNLPFERVSTMGKTHPLCYRAPIKDTAAVKIV